MEINEKGIVDYINLYLFNNDKNSSLVKEYLDNRETHLESIKRELTREKEYIYEKKVTSAIKKIDTYFKTFGLEKYSLSTSKHYLKFLEKLYSVTKDERSYQDRYFVKDIITFMEMKFHLEITFPESLISLYTISLKNDGKGVSMKSIERFYGKTIKSKR